MSEVLHSFYVALTKPRPPSVNHLYVNGPYGRRVLSAEGRKFKSALTSAVAEELILHRWKDAVDAVYDRGAAVRLVISVHADLLNKSWRENAKAKTEKGQRRSPYKKLDASSYIKAIEDAVADGTGIDDSANVDVRALKHPSSSPYVEIFYEVIQCPWDRNGL